MTKRKNGSPEGRAQRWNVLSSFADGWWYALLAAAAALWIAVSLLLFSAPALRWGSLAAVPILAVPAILRLRSRHPASSFSRYHTPVMETLLRSDFFPLVVLDRKGGILEMNEASVQLLGYPREQLIGQRLEPIVETGSRQYMNECIGRTLDGGMKQANVQIIHGSGFPLDLQVMCAPMLHGGGTIGTVLLCQDMSDRKRNIERIRYMAYYDDMTGLPNRTLFYMKMSETLARAREEERLVGLCYLDLDRFKLVNASFGREFGDMLLLQVAERLNRSISEQDLAARLEGDEFAVIMTRADSVERLFLMARELLKAIEEPFELKGFPVQITASMGIAVNRSCEDDGYALLKKADIALAKAKEGGKNDCMLYSESWSNSSLARLTLQHEMYRAIQRKEFVLLYQPQYDLRSGLIVGVEALVRWKHPVKGMVPPSDFIPLAEESGMIVQIGDWVLEEACRQNKEWQVRGLPPMPVSVNLSLRQFAQRDLAARVAAVLETTGLEPRYLDLEITESMTMDIAHVSRCLIELTDMGVGISVDDFGTGYSSFHYLRNFPIDRLKIDRSFVRDIQQDPGDAAIVAAIIAMAHNLNIHVIAEGVETEAQMEFLRKHRCDEMQGYYWSPPVSSESIEQMLSA